MRDELLEPGPCPTTDDEAVEEVGLRPRTLAEFVGQAELKEHLDDHPRGRPAPGPGRRPPALRRPARPRQDDAGRHRRHRAGRAACTSRRARPSSGPATSPPCSSNLDDGDVLFIDEIHRLARAVEEVLYPAMEDFQLDIVLGKGPAARSIRLDLPRFTLVGATTRTGLITGPLRDRFGLVARLDYYEPADLEAHRRAGRRHPRRRRSTAGGRRRDRRPGPGHARASPTACCGGCATSPRCGPTASSTRASPPTGLAAVRRRRARPRQGRPGRARGAVRALRRRPGRAQDPGHQRGRARRDRRGRVRAVPHPAGPAACARPGAGWPRRRRGPTSAWPRRPAGRRPGRPVRAADERRRQQRRCRCRQVQRRAVSTQDARRSRCVSPVGGRGGGGVGAGDAQRRRDRERPAAMAAATIAARGHGVPPCRRDRAGRSTTWTGSTPTPATPARSTCTGWRRSAPRRRPAPARSVQTPTDAELGGRAGARRSAPVAGGGRRRRRRRRRARRSAASTAGADEPAPAVRRRRPTPRSAPAPRTSGRSPTASGPATRPTATIAGRGGADDRRPPLGRRRPRASP